MLMHIDLFGVNRTSRCYAHFWRVRAGKQRYGGNLATAIVGSTIQTTIGVCFSLLVNPFPPVARVKWAY